MRAREGWGLRFRVWGLGLRVRVRVQRLEIAWGTCAALFALTIHGARQIGIQGPAAGRLYHDEQQLAACHRGASIMPPPTLRRLQTPPARTPSAAASRSEAETRRHLQGTKGRRRQGGATGGGEGEEGRVWEGGTRGTAREGRGAGGSARRTVESGQGDGVHEAEVERDQGRK
jgi:hypothetical protein